MAQGGLFVVISLFECFVVFFESFELEDGEEAIDKLIILGETFFSTEVYTVHGAKGLDFDELVSEWRIMYLNMRTIMFRFRSAM